MITATTTCVLCAERGKTQEITSGHCCNLCAAWLRRTLQDVLKWTCAASAWMAPMSVKGSLSRPSFGSRPPINLDAVDPELALLELNVGDVSSAVPILEVFEMWERAIREDRGLLPYGLASAYRSSRGESTLAGCVGFLLGQVEWMVSLPDFDVVSFADHVRRSELLLRRWDTNRDVGVTRYRVPCPTVTDNGECNNTLHVVSGENVYCKHCGRLWEPSRLLAVAGREADIWLDAEAISAHLGIPIRTIQHWGKQGKVARRGMLYRLRDITERDNTKVATQ